MNKKPKDIALDIFIGRKIREKRIKLGWTLDDLSKKLAISYQQVQKYEQGASRISSTLILALSSIFCVSPNYFFDGYSSQEPSLNDIERAIRPRTSPLSILVIEPEAGDKMWISRAFESAKPASNLYIVSSGHKALDLLKNPVAQLAFKKPDIIMMEMNLPDEDWRIILKEIKNDKGYKIVPVIILTNSINRKDMLEAYQLNCTSFINKTTEFPLFKKNIETFIKYWGNVVALP